MAARALRDLPLRRLALAAALLAPAWAGARTEELTLETGGVERRYRLHLPQGAGDGRPLPLVVAFHGAGSTTLQQERASGLSLLADRERFVVVYPEGARRRWATSGARAGDDVQFVRDVIADVARRVPIDARRVYATGISNGGAMAGRVACELADVVAAVATVAGAYPPAEACRPARPVPVLALHGLADRVVPYGGRGGLLAPVETWAAGWAARNGCAGAPDIDRGTPGLVTRSWAGCSAGAEVVLHAVDGLAHAWPGELGKGATPIAASPAMWAFFAAHPMGR